MYAQNDQDGTSAVILRLLRKRSGCGELASDVPIDEKDRRILGPRRDCGRLSVLLG